MKTLRGQALIELIIGMLPYLFIFLGIYLLAGIATGRHDIWRAIASGLSTPSGTNQATIDILERRFGNDKYSYKREDGTFDPGSQVVFDNKNSATRPLPPYDNDDLRGGLTRDAIRITSSLRIEDGNQVHYLDLHLTEKGEELEQLGILTLPSNVNRSVRISDYRDGMWDFPIDASNELIPYAVNLLMGGLTLDSIQAGFRFTPLFSGSRFWGEDNSQEAAGIREERKFGLEQGAASRDAKVMRIFAVKLNPEPRRGQHTFSSFRANQSGYRADIDINGFSEVQGSMTRSIVNILGTQPIMFYNTDDSIWDVLRDTDDLSSNAVAP